MNWNTWMHMKLPQFLWPTWPWWDLQSSPLAPSSEWTLRAGRKLGNVMIGAICQDGGMLFISFIGLMLFELYYKLSVSTVAVIRSSWCPTQLMWIGNFSATVLSKCATPTRNKRLIRCFVRQSLGPHVQSTWHLLCHPSPRGQWCPDSLRSPGP